MSSKMDKLSSSSNAKITCLEVRRVGVTSSRDHSCQLQVANALEPAAAPWPVLHCHWADWPDRGVPPDSKTLIVLRRRMTNHGFPVRSFSHTYQPTSLTS